ncbi:MULTISPECIES: DUF732 domain-containing protein [unclassified Cryobacterium]|uniref:DUF732 domain-containing protein n=1 Tax=unclassified Cryobacterium TaxID=2649013 RepID=UPI00106C5F65|nr:MULTISPECIES: DUF732 domain-containing protein [unclassified Cryobacterium]TFC59401.1 hypothetical protein E3O68_00435 [Cryobacterium sp. TMB3-1-2]TFC67197.1 hypothetical protein E3T21_17130 [Cryobacterium sp. TMB3-15]TFC73290.1 hypothetical protein E3T22_16925 [Cryobacterium sp. TMB3-10]TFD46178.1 hypothetical protein E3T58_01560 [Cryobacterium sp. TMB3-12]
MFKTLKLVAAVGVVLVLGGCSAGASSAAVEKAAPKVVASAEPSAEPVALEPDDGLTTPAITEGSDTDYLREVRLRLKGMNDTTDTELVAAGHAACDLYGTGGTRDTIDIVEGDAPGEPMSGYNDIVIATWAATTYCSEFVS